MNFATAVKCAVLLVFHINRSLSTAQAWFLWRTLTSAQNNFKYPFEVKVIYFENPLFIAAQVAAVHYLRS